jgi:leader peptidase (prepilin peptidase) / N-methyltransferase
MTLSSSIPRGFTATLLAAIGVAGWATAHEQGWMAWITCFLGWSLLALAASDVRRFRLPDYLTLPLVPTGLIVAYGIAPAHFLDHLFGCIAGFAIFVLIGEAYRRLRRRDGLGFGDAKLMAALGAWLGWPGLPSVVLIAALSGLSLVMIEAALGRGVVLDRPLPFGAYLSLGAWLVWLYGPLAL